MMELVETKIGDLVEKKIETFNKNSVSHFRYVDISSIDNIKKEIVDSREISSKDAPSRAKYILKQSDIIVSNVRPNLNAVAIVNKFHDASIGSSGFTVLRPVDGVASDYLFLNLISPNFLNYVEALVQGAMYPAISDIDVKRFKIKLPKNKTDQQRIASVIKSKLEKVEQMRQEALKQKEAVEALHGALLRDVFPYKAGDELPKGWNWKKLDDVAKVNKLRKKKLGATPKEPTSFVPMECVDDVTGKILKTFFRAFDELGQSYTYFENGDIIFAKITPCMQNGKCAIVSEMKDGFGYGSSEYIVFTPSKPIYTKWVHYFLRTVELRKNSEEHFTGSAGQQRVPVDYLQKYQIPVPEDETQIEKITDALDNKHEEYFRLITQTEKQLEAIQALSAAVLREVLEFNTSEN